MLIVVRDLFAGTSSPQETSACDRAIDVQYLPTTVVRYNDRPSPGGALHPTPLFARADHVVRSTEAGLMFDPVTLGDMFHLHKDRCGGQIEANCRLVTHPLGFELRLEIAGSIQRSQVCRSQDEVLETSDQWKLAMIEKTWH
jgi:hypothetical protein